MSLNFRLESNKEEEDTLCDASFHLEQFWHVSAMRTSILAFFSCVYQGENRSSAYRQCQMSKPMPTVDDAGVNC